MKRRIQQIAVAFALAGVGCSDSVGPDPNPGSNPGDGVQGSWSGAVAQGASVEIKGIGGAIRASASSGSEVVVSWTKRGRHDDESAVRIEVVEHDEGITLCAVYPDVPGWGANECLPGLASNMHVENNDVEVAFVVSLPDGVHLIARNIAGDIEARGITGNVFGYSIGGDIDITTSGLAAATTMSGSITASLGLATWDRDLAFTTMSGNVRVTVPANTNADVWAASTRGRVTSDFRLTELSAGRMRGTLGHGGRRLTLTAIDGDVTLKRGAAR